jgi:hypothetical protein
MVLVELLLLPLSKVLHTKHNRTINLNLNFNTPIMIHALPNPQLSKQSKSEYQTTPPQH